MAGLIPPGADISSLIPPLAVNFTSLLGPLTEAAVIRSLPNCTVWPLKQNGICDTSLSIENRAAALINAFTFDEKLNHTSFALPEIPRLGLPRFTLWNEALHGLASSIGVVFSTNETEYSYATSFGQPILTAAAFDDALVYEIATTISNEARAFGNVGRAGLDFWTPNVNPFRDPRWGRGKETPGEDPFRVASYTRALLAGLEGPKDASYKKMVATCKHSAAYDLENWHNITRYGFNAEISMQDLAEYYLPPFEACVRDAQVGSIMCSYNALNGTPTCADAWLQNILIREHWGWNQTEQYITSDCFALDQIFVSHNYTATAEQAAQAALKAGTDTDCGVFYPTFLPNATAQGVISESDIDRALERVYASLIRLGYFDPPESQPYRSLSWKDVNTPAARKLARKAASAGMVLLKNIDKTLPLQVPHGSKNLSILLVGDWANATIQMLGGYSGTPPYIHSPLHALQRVPGISVNFVRGINDTSAAVQGAKNSDVVLFIGGIDETVEAEGHDREFIAWNSSQINLINAVSSVGKPTVIVQTGGGQLDDTQLLGNINISSILWAGYPGQDGGPAIMDVLFGTVAPAGRLPITQYPAKYINVPMTDMALRPDGQLNPGRTYKWYDTPVLPFGYGLHYTSFECDLQLDFPTSICISDILQCCDKTQPLDTCHLGTVTAKVHNVGGKKSDYTALAFLRGDGGPPPYPNKELVGYKKLHNIAPSRADTAKLVLTVGSLARWNEKGQRVLYPGSYSLALDTTPELAKIRFKVTGKPQVLETLPPRSKQ